MVPESVNTLRLSRSECTRHLSSGQRSTKGTKVLHSFRYASTPIDEASSSALHPLIRLPSDSFLSSSKNALQLSWLPFPSLFQNPNPVVPERSIALRARNILR